MPQPFDAVLVIAFGGPQAPSDIRPFLENVLRGRRVAPGRIEEVAHHYEAVGGRSPITELTMQQAEGLEARLAQAGMPLPVFVGMRNWHPYLADTLALMARSGIRRAVGVIAAAHRSYSSCTQYRENVAEARAALAAGGLPDVEVTHVEDWYTHPSFIAAQVDRVTSALETLPRPLGARARLIFTAHSIPESMAARYPYRAQFEETAGLIARAVRAADSLGSRDADLTDSSGSRDADRADPLGARDADRADPLGARDADLTDSSGSRDADRADSSGSRDADLARSSGSRDADLTDSSGSRDADRADSSGSRDADLARSSGSRDADLARSSGSRDADLTDSSGSRDADRADSSGSRDADRADSSGSRDADLTDSSGSRDADRADSSGSRDADLADSSGSRDADRADSSGSRDADLARSSGSRDADLTDSSGSRDADRADRLHLRYATVYQSRSGRPEDPWLGPDICDYLREERARGLEAAVIAPIGFVCDHVEVLYDLDVEAAALCREIGLPMVRALAVNDHPLFLDALADVVLRVCRRYERTRPLELVAAP